MWGHSCEMHRSISRSYSSSAAPQFKFRLRASMHFCGTLQCVVVDNIPVPGVHDTPGLTECSIVWHILVRPLGWRRGGNTQRDMELASTGFVIIA